MPHTPQRGRMGRRTVEKPLGKPEGRPPKTYRTVAQRNKGVNTEDDDKEKKLRDGDVYKVFCLDPHDLYIEYEKDENINDQENIRRLRLNNCIRNYG